MRRSVLPSGVLLELESTEEEKAAQEADSKALEDLTKVIKDNLGERVEKVVVSQILSTSPAVLVSGQYGWSANSAFHSY